MYSIDDDLQNAQEPHVFNRYVDSRTAGNRFIYQPGCPLPVALLPCCSPHWIQETVEKRIAMPDDEPGLVGAAMESLMDVLRELSGIGVILLLKEMYLRGCDIDVGQGREYGCSQAEVGRDSPTRL